MKLANKTSIKDRAIILLEGDYGKTTKETLDIEWKKYSVDEAQEMMQRIRNGETTEDIEISEALINISNLVDDDNQKITYSQDILIQLMNDKDIRKGIVKSFMAVQLGREVLKQKN